MISFRFHLVSLVAVFLALGLGVLSGTTVINQGIVRNLEEGQARQEATNESLRRQLDELAADLEGWNNFGAELTPYLVADRLVGRQFILLTEEGTDEGAVAGVQDALEEAGGEILTLLSVATRMSLPTEEDALDLAAAIGVDGEEDPEALKAEAAAELAEDLSFGSAGQDVVPDLLGEEFLLGPDPTEAEMDEWLRADGIVVVAGGRERPAPSPERFLVPFVAAIAQNGTPVAATETTDSTYDFVTLLRADAAVAERIVTQDNVDQPPGEIGLVLALDALLATGQEGHFGVKDGASSVIPPPT